MADTKNPPDMRLEMFSQPRLLAAARAMVHHFAQRLGFTDAACGQISLAVDEALCNIINHGYDRRPDGEICISVWALDSDERQGLRIIIEDRARQVDPADIKPRDLEEIRPGGLGVHIIREVMDSVRYERREGGGMRLTMVKQIADPEQSTASSTPVAKQGAAHE